MTFEYLPWPFQNCFPISPVSHQIPCLFTLFFNNASNPVSTYESPKFFFSSKPNKAFTLPAFLTFPSADKSLLDEFSLYKLTSLPFPVQISISAHLPFSNIYTVLQQNYIDMPI